MTDGVHPGAAWSTPLDDAGYELDCASHRYMADPSDQLSCAPPAVVPSFTYSHQAPPYVFTLDDATLFTCQ